MTDSDANMRPLGDRYEIGDLVGRGGMADVYAGRDTRLGRPVAIKMLRSDLAADETFQERFRREAQSAASLNHPSIVAVYDTGEAPDPKGATVPYIVMELVEGRTLRDILRDGRKILPERALSITADILSALDYSHRAGIIHRDIKPANVMLTPDGKVKVMDFGIARALTDASGGMTQTQAVVGTAQYLSPEQARGEVVDTRSDLYSTGCLLYELLTGRPPFVGDSAVSVAYQHVSEEATPPSALAPDVPEALDRIVMKALAKDKEQRYGSADEFRADLEAAAGEGVVHAPPLGAKTTVLGAAGAAGATQVFNGPPPEASPATRAEALAAAEEDEEPKRNTALIWILVTVGVIALAGIIWLLLTRDDGAEEPTPTETVTEELVQIPDMTGMTEDEIVEALAAVQLEASFNDPEPSDTVEAGLFLRSEPEAGQTVDVSVETNRVVQVWLSAGPDSIRVPDVSGMTQDEARQELVAAGFDAANFTVTPENIPSRAEGIVDRTEPAARTDAAPDARIEIFIGTGRVELPDLRGLPVGEAQDILRELDLDYQFRDPVNSNDWDQDTIAVTEPGAGLVAYDELVYLTVSLGPAPETPTTEPTTDEETETPPGDEPEPPDDPTEEE